MSDLKRLKRQRDGYQNQLEAYFIFVSNLPESFNELDEENLVLIREKTKQARRVFDLYYESQNDVQCNIPSTQVNDERNDRNIFIDKFDLHIAKVIARTDTLEKLQKTTSQIEQSHRQTSSNNNNTIDMTSLAKLPRINIAPFDGSPDKWLEFKDIFTSLIHDDARIPNIQKFFHLKGVLKGEASNVLQSITMTNENYNAAFQTLIDRYDNYDLIKQGHVKAIFELPNITRESASSLRNLIDSISKNLRCLESLKEPVQQWDTLLIYIVTSKLDSITRKEWEIKKKQLKAVNFKELTEFIKSRWEILESINISRISHDKEIKPISKFKLQSHFSGSSTVSCVICSQSHMIYDCPQFRSMSPRQRRVVTSQNKMCFNCLKWGHFSKNCRLSTRCKKCNGRHSTFLHISENINSNQQDKEVIDNNSQEIIRKPQGTLESQQNSIEISNAAEASVSCHTRMAGKVLLSTALIGVFDSSGVVHRIRALLDSGSQTSIITKEIANKLKLNIRKENIQICGIGRMTSNAMETTNCLIESSMKDFQVQLNCIIMENITSNVPQASFSPFNLPSHIQLADPTYNVSSKIDILLGADVFWSIIKPEVYNLSKNGPNLQQTKLGWIVTGRLPYANYHNTIHTHVLQENNLEQLIQRFWSIDTNCNDVPQLTKEEKACEEHFKQTMCKAQDGRFMVKVPFKSEIKVGNSKDIAKQRFLSVEKRLNSNRNFKEYYIKFMQDYINLGHMLEISENQADQFNSVYLPHHGVLRETSSTTKLRVVFDASCKTTNGYSLNDFQYKGPVVQDELFSILIRFRKHKYVLTADIEKMYRQILLQPSDRKYHQILWRENNEDRIKTYQLNTVTYGTTSAPFLATRCLKEIALENQSNYPAEAQIIAHDFYVDDLITGHENIEKLKQYKSTIHSICKRYGFILRKYRSNDMNLCEVFESKEAIQFSETDNKYSKTLGIEWNAIKDTLHYSQPEEIKNFIEADKITKRQMLSKIAQIYDPLGLIAPIVLQAKLLMQQLWTLKCNWDDVVPEELAKQWMQFTDDIKDLSQVKIDRHIKFTSQASGELHGFADASEKAYGSCIYLKMKVGSETHINLICAKSKIAPLKQQSLPRLELMAALLLAQLMHKIKSTFENFKIIYWSDSKIVIDWIHSSSRKNICC